jgi:hypothetical protein
MYYDTMTTSLKYETPLNLMNGSHLSGGIHACVVPGFFSLQTKTEETPGCILTRTHSSHCVHSSVILIPLGHSSGDFI